MSSERLRAARLVVSDGIVEFIHDVPAKRNPMNDDLRADYLELLQRVENDSSVRAVVIAGAGGSFCAGGDLNLVASFQGEDPSQRSASSTMRERLRTAHRWLDRLRRLDVPVIAAVDGAAYGAGAGLALQADFLLASTRAVFCLSFVKIGAVPDFGALHTLPRIVGLARAKELAMTGRRFDAQEAHRLGIVLSLHEPEALLADARTLAARLAEGPRDAMGMIKHSLNRSFETDAQTMAEIETHQQAVAASTPFHAAEVERFLRKQPFRYDWDRRP